MRVPALKLTAVAAAALGMFCAIRPAVAQETEVHVLNDTDNKEFVVVIGPIDLPAAGEHSHGAHGAVFPPIRTVQFPAGAYLVGFSYEVVDSAGRKMPTETLHHLNLINPDNRELFLPISQRMLAVGQETGSQSMPRLLFGYPVPEGTNMVVSLMMHNPTPEPYTGVEVRVHLKYVKPGRPWPLFDVYPFQLDVGFPAGDKSVDLPPGESQFSYEGSPALEGRMMVIGSHLHDLATSIRLEDITKNKLIWEGFPVEDDDGVVTGVTIGRLYRKLGVKIYPDHVYRMTVYYHNPTTDTIPAGGMGVLAGVFMPSTGGMWPKADKGDELYALDRRHYLRQVRGPYELIAAGGGELKPGSDEQTRTGHEH